MADWNKIDDAGKVDDRRGATMAFGGAGLVGAILVAVLSLASGSKNIDLNQILDQVSSSGLTTQSAEKIDPNDTYANFASKVVGSNNKLWQPVVDGAGDDFVEPQLVLFRKATKSGCGVASSDVGPHYCPVDNTIYLDETFFEELKTRFGAKGGDVAEAYVMAHEYGHHVQNLLGISDKVENESKASPGNASKLSVSQELQADCFAGVWAKSVEKIGVIGPGEIDEAINAAEAVGDDRIQKSSGNGIHPETWTHGSASDRALWFNAGYKSGSPKNCQTF